METIIDALGVSVRARAATVTLSLRSVPLLYVYVETTRLEHDYGAAVRQHSRIRLGAKLEGVLLGVQTNRGRDDEHSRTTLVAALMEPSFEEWLGLSPRAGSSKILVYQRGLSETPRNYLERLLDRKIDWEESEALERDNVFRMGACMWRNDSCTNLRFIEETVDFIRQRKPSIEGWYALNEVERPIRIATKDEHILEMDDGWWGLEGIELDAVSLPALGVESEQFGSDEFVLKRYFWLENASMELKLDTLVRFASKGPPIGAAGLSLTQDSEQCIMGPGPVRYGDQQYLAHEVSYEVQFEVDIDKDNSVVCTVHMRNQDTVTSLSPMHDLRLPVHFNAWNDSSDHSVLIKSNPSSDGNGGLRWSLHESESIYGHYHTPSWVRDSHRGLYNTLAGGDLLYVTIRAGELPVVTGGRQMYSTELEKSSISMSSERDGLFTCPPTTPNEGQYGYYIVGGDLITGRVQVNTVDSDLMRINENIDIFREQTKVYFPMNYKGNVDINKLKELNVSPGALTRSNLNSSAGAAGAASGGGGGGRSRLDNIQLALSVAGFIPGLGSIANAANAVINISQGKWGDAALNIVGIIPLFGTTRGVVSLSRNAFTRFVKYGDKTRKAQLASVAKHERKIAAQKATLTPQQKRIFANIEESRRARFSRNRKGWTIKDTDRLIQQDKLIRRIKSRGSYKPNPRIENAIKAKKVFGVRQKVQTGISATEVGRELNDIGKGYFSED